MIEDHGFRNGVSAKRKMNSFMECHGKIVKAKWI